MFYRLFGKLSGSKGSSAGYGSRAASTAGESTTAALSASGGVGAPITTAANGDANAPSPTHGNPVNESGAAVSDGARGNADRRAFQGEEHLLEHPRGPRRYPLDPDDDAELLVLLAQQYPITSVVITHYRVKENYVEYVIECVRGFDAWRVYRRYQQFKALDHDLRQLCVGRHGSSHGAYGVVPVLPGSHWMDVTNQSPELVEQRRRYLEIYLQQLLVPKNLFYVARTALFDFLHNGEVPTHLRTAGIQPLLGLMSTGTNEMDREDSEEAIQKEQLQQLFRRQQQPGAVRSEVGTQQDAPASSSTSPSTPRAAGPACASAISATASTSCQKCVGRGVASAVDGGRALPAPRGATEPHCSASPGSALLPTSCEVPVTAATSSTLQSDGDREKSDDNGGSTTACEAQGDDREEILRSKKSLRTLEDEILFVATPSLQLSFMDERLPPASANCAQCNAEFTSFLYPYRCFFCRVQFCTPCLQKVSPFEGEAAPTSAAAATVGLGAKELARSPLQTVNPSDAPPKVATSSVLACRQCAENYSRRLDRCVAAPGGGAYRGMQSTLGLPSQDTAGEGNSGALPTSPAASTSPILSSTAYIGGEQGSMLLLKRVAGPGSPQPRCSPRCSMPCRSGLSAVGFHDFKLLTVIGRGTFGKVLKVQQRSTGRVYAMKIMNKATVYKRCMTSYMKEEKSILTSMQPHPYIVRCYYAFQTDYYLIFIMDYLPGGELYNYLYPRLRLTPEAACTYAAELVLALEHLHRQDIVHRDVKPENVVLTADGHICLTDFGLARRAFSRSRRRSFVGSPEYVAPETIQGQVQTAAVDWWSFGIMLYEMLAGRTPFHARNNNTVYDNVLHKELKLPLLKTGVTTAAAKGAADMDAMSPISRVPLSTATASTTAEGTAFFKGFTSEASSILSGLLTRDASMRLQNAASIKEHPFFRNVDWEALQRRKVPAPCRPGDLRDNDVRHFKREFVSEWATVPPLTSMTRASIDALTRSFENFPVSRTQGTTSSSPSSACVPPSSATVSPQMSGPGATSVHTEICALSPSLTHLPPSVLSPDGRTLREPVHFAQSIEAAQKSFQGVWRVVSVEAHALDDGRIIFPWGGSVTGLLMYSPDARFSLQLSPSARQHMGPVQRVGQLSKEDLCDAYCSYVASFGRFQLFPSSADDGCGVVRHYAEGNLCANLMFTHTVFQYRMDVEPVSQPEESGQRREIQSDPQMAIESQVADDGVMEALPKPTWAPGTCNIESSAGGVGASSESGSFSQEANKRATIGESADKLRRKTPAQPTTPPKLRYVLRLSTRPQRAFEEDFMAFTSLVFEKLE
ncbi:putative zinc finger protein kinase [Leptomonas seymouri]|uniref:Putative zinc finger protein kinase n=1 Tax=Leptomonas seymouri TaxID=5684 RepID=A0A0N1IMC0_LEPSE|nr:putative zinc finger protein kinase [Leptomonas seymouri]|eukprot:KPI89455.1 putative zinc finger protein kinase [Leptomonas seymouri]